MNWGKTEIWWNDADLDRLHCCCFGMMYFCVFFCFDKWIFGGSSSAGSQPQKERSPIITFFLKCWVRVLFSALWSINVIASAGTLVLSVVCCTCNPCSSARRKSSSQQPLEFAEQKISRPPNHLITEECSHHWFCKFYYWFWVVEL